MKKGFTLIELLIVVAIIGILVGAITLATSGARVKAQLTAFKKETRGSYAGLANSCTTTGSAIAVPSDTIATDWAGVYIVDCSSAGKFTITAVPKNASIDCIATVTENGATYKTSGGSSC